jgi:hypothetical protein
VSSNLNKQLVDELHGDYWGLYIIYYSCGIKGEPHVITECVGPTFSADGYNMSKGRAPGIHHKTLWCSTVIFNSEGMWGLQDIPPNVRLGVKPPQSDIILTIKVKYIPMENRIGRW